MKTTIIDRLGNLLEAVPNPEAAKVCETILDYAKYSNEDQIFDICNEKLSAFTEVSQVEAFLLKEKRINWIKSGFASAFVDAVLETAVVAQSPGTSTQLHQIKQQLNESKVDPYTAIDVTLRAITEHMWNRDLKQLVESEFTEQMEEWKHEIRIYSILEAISKANQSNPLHQLTADLNNQLETFLYECAIDALPGLMLECQKWVKHPEYRAIFESLEALANRNKRFAIKNADPSNFEINDVYTLVHINEDRSITFMLNGKTFSYDGQSVTPRAVSRCDKGWLSLMESLDKWGVKISENRVEFEVDDVSFEILLEKETPQLHVNRFPVPENNIDNYFIYSGMRNPRVLNAVPLVNQLLENAPRFVSIDFAKQIRSKVFKDMNVTIFKPENDELVSVLKHQGAINETKLYKNLNVLQLKQMVTGFMGFDISESFSEWLPQLEADELRIEREQKDLLAKIQEYRNRLTQITEESKQLSENDEALPQLEQLAVVVSNAIADLKEQYNTLSSKKKSLNEALINSDQTGHQWGDKTTPGTRSWDYGESSEYQHRIDADHELDWLNSSPAEQGEPKLYPNQTVKIKSKNIIGKLINIDYVNSFATVLPAGGLKTIICRPDQLESVEK